MEFVKKGMKKSTLGMKFLNLWVLNFITGFYSLIITEVIESQLVRKIRLQNSEKTKLGNAYEK